MKKLKLYYTIKEIAGMLNLNQDKVRSLIKQHKIPHVRGASKKRRIQITRDGFELICQINSVLNNQKNNQL